ncbi:1,5-anhydro-D-fructose reductase-like isoform X4 [Periplaneta americana]|uniref:1,5-anhydro-D-fructose reductase-like isoform X4 n=1 Tax=Periplaneta americana TaxID=6978 RepID=UPI0037E78A4B
MTASTVRLNNNLHMPVLGLGTSQAKPGEMLQVVKDAIDIGYRSFDTAKIYGNDHEVGEAIREKIAQDTVKREELFVTNKLWCSYNREDLVVPNCKKTLEAMGLDYLDLYLIHFPTALKEGDHFLPKDENDKIIYSDADYVDTWRGMEKCVELGLVKSIGLSNFNSQQIDRVLEIATIKPVVNQIQHGVVPIPKSSNINRLQQNIDVFDFELSLDELATIDALDIDSRIFTYPHFMDSKDYPFYIEF